MVPSAVISAVGSSRRSRVGEVHRRLEVPGRMAAGDDDACCRHACPCRGCVRRGRRSVVAIVIKRAP
jgi:hypothetical protein